MISTVILVLHVLAAVLLVGLVLIQQGQGADAGAAFGSGASQTVFGSQGAGSFLTRATTTLAVLFFATSLTLAYFANTGREAVSVVEIVPEVESDAMVEKQVPADLPAAAPTVHEDVERNTQPVIPD